MSESERRFHLMEEAERTHRELQRFHLIMIIIELAGVFFIWKLGRK